MVRIAAESVRQTGRGTQGVRVVNLKEGDRLISMARVAESGDEEADGGEEPVDG
ncbi:MAG: DNA gyrase C-terminal beta-propeller domain-containing protein [Planctomycetota bacterium]